MAKYRRGRINDAVAKELAIALGNVREPKVVNNFVSIVAMRCMNLLFLRSGYAAGNIYHTGSIA